MRTFTALIALVTALAATTVLADGFIMRLPDDGSWARFDVDMKFTFQGQERGNKGNLRISSVGQETVGGEKCRWIEIELGSDQFEGTNVFKLLIPERYLKAGESPTDHIVRGWERRADQTEARPLREKGMSEGIPMFLSGPLDGAEKLEPVEITSVLGKLMCPGIKGAKAFAHESKGLEHSVTATYRLHEKAPFGVVAAELETSVTRGEPKQSWTLKCRLVEHGTNANTSLPGSK